MGTLDVEPGTEMPAGTFSRLLDGLTASVETDQDQNEKQSDEKSPLIEKDPEQPPEQRRRRTVVSPYAVAVALVEPEPPRTCVIRVPPEAPHFDHAAGSVAQQAPVAEWPELVATALPNATLFTEAIVDNSETGHELFTLTPSVEAPTSPPPAPVSERVPVEVQDRPTPTPYRGFELHIQAPDVRARVERRVSVERPQSSERVPGDTLDVASAGDTSAEPPERDVAPRAESPRRVEPEVAAQSGSRVSEMSSMPGQGLEPETDFRMSERHFTSSRPIEAPKAHGSRQSGAQIPAEGTPEMPKAPRNAATSMAERPFAATECLSPRPHAVADTVDPAPSQPEPPAQVEPEVAAAPRSGEVKVIRLTVPSPGGHTVDVRLRSVGQGIEIASRASNETLARQLQEGLPEVLHALREGGYEVVDMQPGAASNSSSRDAHDEQQSRERSSGEPSSSRDDGRQQQNHQRRRDEDRDAEKFFFNEFQRLEA